MFVGFDPGKTGGLVAVRKLDGGYESHAQIPLIGAGKRQRVDGRAVCDYLRSVLTVSRDVPVLAMEKVHSMPTDSVVSAFTFGKATGQVIGIAEALGFAVHEIAPRDWQRTMLRGYPRSTRVLRKKSCALVASDMHPTLAPVLRVKATWGLADASLIVEHLRRQLIRAN